MAITLDGSVGITLPASGDIFSASLIQSDTSSPPIIQNSSGTQIGTFCRAWVQFNGSGTPAIAASFNVSSITDHAVGEYSINFTNSLPDGNYSSSFSCNDNTNASVNSIVITTAPATTSVRIAAVNSASGALDLTIISASFFR
jgi:hypothetical protein